MSSCALAETKKNNATENQEPTERGNIVAEKDGCKSQRRARRPVAFSIFCHPPT
jgi:hypothetical protein